MHRTNVVIYGLLIVALVGCNARHPQPGSAPKTKAEQARKQAEELALGVVKSAGNRQAKSSTAETFVSEKPGSGGSTLISPQSIAQQSKTVTPVVPQPPPAQQTPAPPSLSAVEVVGASMSNLTKSPIRPGSPVIINIHVKSSIPYDTIGEAEDDALTKARDEIEHQLAALDPPVQYRPSLNEIRNEFARKDSRTIRTISPEERKIYKSSGENKEYYYAEYNVEVTADQIRDLRTRDRVTFALRVFCGLTFISLAGFLFLRADEWTKGYLTRYLACAAVALAGGAAAVLFFV